jgi:hypothetical protein
VLPNKIFWGSAQQVDDVSRMLEGSKMPGSHSAQ